MARRFASTDVLTLSPGSAPTAMAGTWIVFFRPYDAQFDILATNTDIVTTLSSTTTRQALFLDAGKIFANNDFGAGGTGPTDKNGWYALAFTKVSGTNAYRYHLAAQGGSFTHSASGSSADGTAGITSIIFGKGNIKGGAKFDIAAAAMWTSALSDAAIDALGTSSMDTWLGASPVAAWQFNQASTGTAVNDLVGSANQTALTGTTVVADPVGWSYHASTTPFTKDVVETYRVFNAFTKDVVERYRVYNPFTKDVVESYRVTNAWSKDVIERYRVTNGFAKDVVETYRVFNSITKDVVERYRITNAWTKDVVDTYRVFNGFTKDVIERYNVLSGTAFTKDVIERYRVFNPFSADVVERYRVLGVWSVDVVERYRIFASFSRDVAESYRIFGPWSKDIIERYAVGPRVALVPDVTVYLGPVTLSVTLSGPVELKADLSASQATAYLD